MHPPPTAPRPALRFLADLDDAIRCVACLDTIYIRPAWWASASVAERFATLRAARGDTPPEGVYCWGWAPADGRLPWWSLVPDETWEALAQLEAPARYQTSATTPA